MPEDQPPVRTWFLLHHSAGPAIESDGSVYDHPAALAAMAIRLSRVSRSGRPGPVRLGFMFRSNR